MDKLRHLYHQYHDFIMYAFFGGLTTLVNLVTFWALYYTPLHVSWLPANTIAWFLSVTFAFFTNKTWVFRSPYTTASAFFIEMFWFFAARGVSLGADTAIMWVGIDLLHASAMLTKIVDQIVVILMNYVFSKWIFHSSDANTNVQESTEKKQEE